MLLGIAAQGFRRLVMPIRYAGFSFLPVALACLATGLTAGGCSGSKAPAPAPAPAAKPHADDHGHDHGEHAHPETLAAGVAELEKLLSTVGEKLASGATEAADDAVHAVGHLIGDLEGLLGAEKLGAEAQAAGKKALDELFECFDKLDTALHANEGEGESPAKVHESLADRMKAALEALKGIK
jgi:hypothetical protein